MNTFWKVLVGAIGGGALMFAAVWGLPLVKVVDLDESEPQREAAITVSDPLLYARETLINDRREEYEYLSKLLIDSEKVQFPPQVLRDMNALSVIKAHGSVQTPGAVEPQTIKTDLPNKSPAQNAPGATSRSGEQPKPDAVSQIAKMYSPNASLGAAPQEEFRDRQAYRGDLRAALASVNLDDLHDLAGNALFRLQFKVATFPGKIKNKFGVAQLTVLPPRLLDDDITSIYRVWLGHTSSRLNYFAGRGKLVGDSQFGSSGTTHYMKLIRIGLSKKPEPTVEKDPCLSLRPASLRTAALNNGFIGNEVFECHTLSLAVLPDSASPEWLFTHRDAMLLRTVASLPPIGNSEDAVALCRQTFRGEDLPLVLKTAVDVLKIEPGLEAALDGVIAGSDQIDRRRVSSGGEAEELKGLRTDYQLLGAAAADARAYLSKVAAAARIVVRIRELLPDSDAECFGPTKVDVNLGKFQAPTAFVDALTEPRAVNDPPGRLVKGQAYAYGTTPIELAQRLSTTASTAASMELALALSGKLQAESGSLLGGSDYMRSVAQTAAFLERIPLVVGFSDRRGQPDMQSKPLPRQASLAVNPGPDGTAATRSSSSSLLRAPQFGWVFGPKARFDMGKQRFVFEQTIGSFDVAADISVPSWWPKVELAVETSWVANWNEANEVLRKTERPLRAISVPLPVNRADLDGLTKFLMRDSIRRSAELTTIHFVEPTILSACANEVTVLIYGANVWRSAEVYLGGLRGTEIKVLPDMEGISAKFNLGDFYKNRNNAVNPLGYEEVILRVNSRNGRDLSEIRIVGSRQPTGDKNALGTCLSPYSVASPIVRHQRTSAPTIFAVAPSGLERCSDKTRIMLTGRNLMSPQELTSELALPKVFLNGRSGEVFAENPAPSIDAPQVISVTFERGATDTQRSSHDLIVLNPAGFTTASLDAMPCGGMKDGAVASTQTNPPTPPSAHVSQGAPQGAVQK